MGRTPQPYAASPARSRAHASPYFLVSRCHSRNASGDHACRPLVNTRIRSFHSAADSRHRHTDEDMPTSVEPGYDTAHQRQRRQPRQHHATATRHANGPAPTLTVLSCTRERRSHA
jgi:hypothetical protein